MNKKVMKTMEFRVLVTVESDADLDATPMLQGIEEALAVAREGFHLTEGYDSLDDDKPEDDPCAVCLFGVSVHHVGTKDDS